LSVNRGSLKFARHSVYARVARNGLHKLPKIAATKLAGKDVSVVSRLRQLVSRMDGRDEKLLVGFAQKLARR
jgi:hypothetical protein